MEFEPKSRGYFCWSWYKVSSMLLLQKLVPMSVRYQIGPLTRYMLVFLIQRLIVKNGQQFSKHKIKNWSASLLCGGLITIILSILVLLCHVKSKKTYTYKLVTAGAAPITGFLRTVVKNKDNKMHPTN
jgi:hypothetical protein